MPLAERLRRFWRRTDTRAAAAIGSGLVLVLLLQSVWLYSFTAVEELEQADHWLVQTRELAVSLAAQGIADETLVDSAFASLPGGRRAVRLWQGDSLEHSAGDWPDARHRV